MSLATVSSRTKIISNALVADMKATFAVSRTLERQSLELKRKLVKERKVAYAALASRGRGTDKGFGAGGGLLGGCLLYTSPSPRDVEDARMPSSA